jgi:hypothetical protein
MLNLQVPSSPVTASQSVCSLIVRLLLLAVPVAGVVIESVVGPGLLSLFSYFGTLPPPPSQTQACFFFATRVVGSCYAWRWW